MELSEEEKKAIEWLKNNLEETIKLGQKYGLQESIKRQTIILNLIDNQQKEIKELKRKQENIEKDYISKEKIDELSSKLFKEEQKYAEDDDRTIPLIKMQNLLFHIKYEDWEEILEGLSK